MAMSPYILINENVLLLLMHENIYCKALFFRVGLIFAYFAENENSAKIKPAKIKLAKAIANRSALSACIHTVLHTQNCYPCLLSAEIHKVPVLLITPFYSIVNSTAYQYLQITKHFG